MLRNLTSEVIFLLIALGHDEIYIEIFLDQQLLDLGVQLSLFKRK